MIYGIEYNTDLRHPNVKIKKFGTISAATKWSEHSCGFAFPAAADESLPPSQSNFHRRLRAVYEMPKGWRPPAKSVIAKRVAQTRGSIYADSEEDVIADAIRQKGKRL